MKSEKHNPMSLIAELEGLLTEQGYDDTKSAWVTLSTLKSKLSDFGYEEITSLGPVSNQGYTVNRATSLLELATRLSDELEKAISSASYSDRIIALTQISEAYLKLAHAFKVDNEVWAFAQQDLLPLLTQTSDEESIDASIFRLKLHLSRYIESLKTWL